MKIRTSRSYIAMFIISAIGAALLFYTAYRSVHFIMNTLPPDAKIAGFLALAAFDLGLIGWVLVLMHGAEGAPQIAISGSMAFLSFVGIAVATIADTLTEAARNGNNASPDLQLGAAALWIMTIIILCNVAAVSLMHLTAPAQRLRHRKEAARAKIHEVALQKIDDAADAIADRIAAQVANEWVAQVTQDIAPALARNGKNIVDGQARTLPEPVTDRNIARYANDTAPVTDSNAPKKA